MMSEQARHAANRIVKAFTVTALASAGAMHIVWGRGSTFPYRSRAELADRVVGSNRAPSPAACYAVAAALGAAATLTAVKPRSTGHRRLLVSISGVFATRATFGFAGHTDRLVPGSASPTFRRQDRRFYSPLCLALALGVWRSARPTS